MIISVHSSKSPMQRFYKKILLFLCAFCCTFSGCKNKSDEQNQPEIAVANSYLHAVVKDLCGDRQEILNLVPPGMCPGHFDISPSQVNRLCNCKILFVFDFQKNIEKAIPRIKDQGLGVCKIKPLPGLCIPDTYLAIAEQIAQILSQKYPEEEKRYISRLTEIKKRLENLAQEIDAKMKKTEVRNMNVAVSQHQVEFAKWLGLNPVSTFAGRDTLTPAKINRNLREANLNQIRFLIANKQEGVELAQALATHLKVKLVVFSNFPLSNRQNGMPSGFDGLVCENVNNLLGGME